jgi:RNA polymerase primary sigma factor
MRLPANKHISELLLQMKFATDRQRQKQLAAAESLLSIIDREREYSYEFICFQITGYRPKGSAAQELLRGSELISDLRIFISQLSKLSAQNIARADGRVYNISELAQKMGVAVKTINRWRKRGLLAKVFVFADGSKRLGFTQSMVDEFSSANAGLIERALKFSQLSNDEKLAIVKRATELGSTGESSRRKVIEQLACEFGRAVETIRYTLADFQESHPSKPLFKKAAQALKPSDTGAIYKLFREGADIPELMEKFGRSKSSIYRIINCRRAREILSQQIEFIPSHEFMNKGEIAEGKTKNAQDPKRDELTDAEKYLNEIEHVSLLNREQEIELFRTYNFMKYRASVERGAVDLAKISSRQVRRIEHYLEQAQQAQKKLIESNLRLVVSIAHKHAATGASISELISEGNLSLMRAVEKFDYTRGFRFSTYASWAIAKDFARRIPAEAARAERISGEELANVQRDLRTSGVAPVAAIEKAGKSLEAVIRDNLSEREQYIIRRHFALTSSVIKKKGSSLAQIGQDLGLSKERVRQLELAALQKLRHCLSPEEFELLTG